MIRKVRRGDLEVSVLASLTAVLFTFMFLFIYEIIRSYYGVVESVMLFVSLSLITAFMLSYLASIEEKEVEEVVELKRLKGGVE